MSVSGLAITLSEREHDAEIAVRALRAHLSIEIGPREGRRIAATADTPSQRDDRKLWQWMNDHAGIESVDVVFVHFDDLDDPDDPDDPDDSGE